jgi:hypothetical protein
MSDLVKRSRRRFLGLIAAGSAAAATIPAAALAHAVTLKQKPAKPAPGAKPAGPRDGAGAPPAVAEEIRKQKAVVAQSLQALRDYPLPPGSEPAFLFAPLRPRRKAGAL